MTTLLLKKLLSITIIAFIALITFIDLSDIVGNSNQSDFFNEYIEDEIEPFCNGINFDKVKNFDGGEIDLIQINLADKEGWYKNFYELSQDRNGLITDKYKDRFAGEVKVNYRNGVICNFKAKIRLTGDLKDHIRNVNEASLDVQLESGNIFGITKFKLFLPETRYGINEIITTSILEKMNIITPRTFQTGIIFNNSKITQYIFQEKIAKELIEYNQFREGPLLQVTEEYFWEKRNQEDVNSLLLFAEIVNKYWSRRSLLNQKISFEALSMYNSYIFNSLDSNNLWVNAKLTYDIKNPKNFEIAKFDIALISLDAQHGLALTNRNFYYDNIADMLLPIYYDGDSQVSERILFLDSPPDLCEKFSDQNYYYRYLCINDYVEIANEIMQSIDFDSRDIHESILKKGVDVETELIDNAFNNFIYNLNYLTLPKNKIKTFNTALENEENFLINTSDYDIKFLFLDSDNNPKVCNQYLKNCSNFDQKVNYFSNSFIDSNKSIHPFAQNLDQFKLNKNRELQKKDKSQFYSIYGNPEYLIDTDKKIFSAYFTEEKQKIVIYAKDYFNGWTFNVDSNVEFVDQDERIDQNSLTGCLTFYNAKVEDLNINLNNLHCEDAVNFVKTSGSINKIEIINSNSDAIDIDFSNLKIKSIFIDSAKNDCIDISLSNINISYASFSHCGDKGVSVGERALVNFDELQGTNSKIGIAIKDSSIVTAKEVEINKSNMCLGIYRKKQEFGPASFVTEKFNCYSEELNFIQKGSKLVLGKDSKND